MGPSDGLGWSLQLPDEVLERKILNENENPQTNFSNSSNNSLEQLIKESCFQDSTALETCP